MKILLSNDDGYQAPGLKTLADVLAGIADITVVAPERNRSGASNSLTLEYPIRAEVAENGFFWVNGTPTDCVHLAITGLLEEEPDMVVAGINEGPNLGDDVLYSGTVAAAMEGRFLGLPAIALSMNSHNPKNYSTGARVALELVRLVQREPLQTDA
ncbi:MAG: 5'/3'-nucleotidase SurE, partial [Halobacteria archaeon]|nr:5'/3'-nucleotidase SurE [Halobacteria archaeon]